MSRPTHQSRDEVYRRLPGGAYVLVPDVVPRAELDRVLEALRKERAATDMKRACIKEIRDRLLALAEDPDVERVMRTLKELSR